MLKLKNLAYNYLSTLTSVGANFIFLPIYLYLLGDKWFGVLSIVIVIQSSLLVLDSGFSATLRREFAVHTGSDHESKAGKLLTLEKASFATLVVFSIILVLTLPNVILLWVNIEPQDKGTVEFALRLVIPLAACQIMYFFYVSGFWGLDDHREASLARMLFILLRNGMVVFVLYFDNSIITFLLYQIFISIFCILVARNRLFFILAEKETVIYKITYFDKAILLRNSRFTKGMFFISLISMVTLQFDKVVLSNTLDSQTLGHYTLAFLLCQSAVMVAVPIGATYFPRLAAALNNKTYCKKSLNQICGEVNLLISTVAFSTSFVIYLFNDSIFYLWTGNQIAQDGMSSVLALLCIGSAAQAMQVLTYNVAVANKSTQILTRISLGMLFITLPLYYIFTSKYSVLGASAIWVVHNLVVTPIFYYFVIVRIVGLESCYRFVYQSFLVLSITVVVGFISYTVLEYVPIISHLKVCIVFLMIISSVTAILEPRYIVNLARKLSRYKS